MRPPNFLFEASKRKCAAPGGKEKMPVPKSCLTAGLGKNGGFSRWAPAVRCLVSALGAGPMFAETSSGQLATIRGNAPWVRIELVSASFPAAAPFPQNPVERQRKEEPVEHW